MTVEMRKENVSMMDRFKRHGLLCLLMVLVLPVFSQRNDIVLTKEDEALLGYDTTMYSGKALQLTASTGFVHFGVGTVAGYRFGRRFFLGMGVEAAYTKGLLYSVLARSSGHYSLQVFLDAKCYLTPKRVAPYFELRAGYAFPLHKVVKHSDSYANHDEALPEEAVYDGVEILRGIYTGLGFGIKVKRSDFSFGVIVNEMYYHHTCTYEEGCHEEKERVDLCPNAYLRYSYTLSAPPKPSEIGTSPVLNDMHEGMAYRLNASIGLLDLPWMLLQHNFGLFSVGGSVGYQFSPIAYFGVGAEYYVNNRTIFSNADYEQLTRGSGGLLSCVPLFADVRVCFSQRVKSLFAEMRLGYSIPLRSAVSVVYGQDFFAYQEGAPDVSEDFVRGEIGKQINGLFGGVGLGYKVGRSAYSVGVNVLGTKCYQKSYYEDGDLRFDENGVNTNVYFRYGLTLQ